MANENGELGAAMRAHAAPLAVVAVLSAALNVLLLGGSIYMMLVYDSVLPSRSIPTLVGLLLMVVAVYVFQGVFDAFRSRLLSDVALSFDRRVSDRVQQAAFTARLRSVGPPSVPAGAIRDLDTIRGFLAGPGPGAFIDAPWVLFFLIVLAVLHVWLAVTALAGACIMGGLTFLTYRASAEPVIRSAQAAVVRQATTEERFRHAEVIHVMGMATRRHRRWEMANGAFLGAQDEVARATGLYGGISRVFRLALQSLILAVGALLVIDDMASGGVIFASSILSARALSPIDQIIAQWRNFAGARDGWKRLGELLRAIPPTPIVATALPRPARGLTVEDCAVAPPGTQRITAKGATFALVPGDVLGVIGQSGSGKSSIVRALVGAWRPVRGSVRLDGATYDQYDPQQLGDCIGYLPQTVELLGGTVGENIARFDPAHSSEAIVAAARQAGVHDLIVSLPCGYETQVGLDGEALSGGQRQRIALARALYRDPFLVVLDEPGSNLDAGGEAALNAAIRGISERGGISVVVTHRSTAIQQANKVLYMADGVARLFGPRKEVMARIAERSRRETAGPEGAEAA